MRTTWRSTTAALAACAVCLWLVPGAQSSVAHAPRAVRAEPAPRPFGADCVTGVSGSHVTASCHNPYPDTDRVQLHVECANWWDVDADGAPVDVGPTEYVELADRCWTEVREVWVSHRPVPGPAGT
ncbi:hypothetical protein ABT160_21005 [Streptomyces sp. NPDC001941]|uniref:hypothetical protein n=1 Tax=Streptomyces sp. NPDC001941 TaxID=3154659 RepID=UPI00332B6CF2